jgi:hypothetical protein
MIHRLRWRVASDEAAADGIAHVRLVHDQPPPARGLQGAGTVHHSVLFELATPSPGFAIDEDPAHLGEALRLPPQYEHLRDRLERRLTPLTNPRATAAQP